MAHTSPVVASSSLQISPNLEALLQYDELARRSTSSPTSSRPSLASSSSEFPFSLPPPPPRNFQPSRKATLPETASPKNVRRQRGVKLRSDSWPDALLVAAPDLASPGESNTTSATSIPNPFINPTPVVAKLDSVIDDGPSTPKPGDMFIPTESPTQVTPDEPVSSPESYTSQSSTAHRNPLALHKVEKMLSKGKGSLVMLATAATPGSMKHRSDSLEGGRKCYRAEIMDADNLPVAKRYLTGTSRLSGMSSTYSKGGASLSDSHAITRLCPTKLKPSSGSTGRYPGSALPSAHPANSDIASTRSLSISSTSSCSSLDVTTDPARTYPASSLPNLPLSSMTSGEERRHEGIQRITDNDSRHSFIDFYSPSYADGLISCSEQGNVNSKNHDPPPRKQQLNLAIPSAKIYGTASGNPSLVSLATMTFAPPSPPFEASPVQHIPNSPSSSSIALSTMIFAPPSPATELPSYGLSKPGSPDSTVSLTPIEFAPPSTPAVGQRRKRELVTAFKMASIRVRRSRGGKRSLSLSPRPQSQGLDPMPPTTNLLGRDERADLVRRNRKLAQVFGQTPGHAMSALDLEEPRRQKKPSLALTSLLGAGKQRNHRQAVSVSHGLVSSDAKTEPSSPWQIDDLWSLGDRRYSIPLTPSSFTFYFNDDAFGTASANNHRGVHSLTDSPLVRDSSSSFIDLSDDEEISRGDEAPTITSLDDHKMSGRRTISHFSSTPSLVDSLDPDRQAEVERRRKRDKLAKLHRFLGSRVPPDLVLGSPADPSYSFPSSPPMEYSRDPWLGGRNGGTLDPHENFDRGKEELDQWEKALNVKRAQKMEKVFGVPPPQTLFHTRQGPSTLPHSQPSSPTSSIYTINPNQSAYRGKSSYRPPPTESARCLLPKMERSSTSTRRVSLSQSSVYLDYEQSLNSLVDIIDRDDRESLLELHRFINTELPDLSLDVENVVDNKRHSVASSHRSERRHSLPSSSSMVSLTSELPSVVHEVSEFQVRRRRAAKLTSFFGVDYCDVIDNILESIERGVEEERKRGTLQPEEVEVLLHRVWSLKSMQGQHS